MMTIYKIPNEPLKVPPRKQITIIIVSLSIVTALFSAGFFLLLGVEPGLAEVNNLKLSGQRTSISGFSPANPSEDTYSIHIPVIEKQTYQTRAIGNVKLLSGPSDCSGEQCYQVEVTCANVIEPIKATLKVGGPSDQTKKGTILFASGWFGTYFWEGSDLAMQLAYLDQEILEKIEAINTNNRTILDNLQVDGFQTVQIRWDEGKAWYKSKNGVVEGQANLACRSASVARWVYSYFHHDNSSQPYCGVGHSNGASQMSFSLAQYGLFDVFSAVILESGPNFSRIDYSCVNDPDYSYLFADTGDRNGIDNAFGGGNNNGPCYNQNPDYLDEFQQASLLIGNWKYSYPKTQLSFIFGSMDTTKTRKQGELFYDRLLLELTPLLYQEVVNGAPHEVTSTPQGAQALENAIRNGCTLH
jgi:hypothetical protein